ncbi:zinc ribbon domain-containing protein [Chloroflexota bacterium]
MDKEATWESAQRKRLSARSVRRIAKDWLLQGMCTCGECGHTLSCLQKDSTEHCYYGCHGRYKHTHLDGGPRCQFPRIKADWLEEVVWERLKDVLSDSDAMRRCIRDVLEELKERTKHFSEQTYAVDSQIEMLRLKKERLGLVFADGAISRDVYTKKLQNLNKQERELLKVRDNLNPGALAEIAEVENTIKSIGEMLDISGSLLVSDFRIWGYTGDMVAPLGYNPWLETACKNEVGRLREMDYVGIEGTDLKIRAICPPEGFWFS